MNPYEPKEIGQAMWVTNETTAPSRKWNPSAAVPWLLTIAWVGVGVAMPWLQVAKTHSFAVKIVILVLAWTLWVGVAVSLLVPSSVSLTAARALVPVALACSIISGNALAILAAALSQVLILRGDVCDHLVRGSAYGDEKRFVLRTPVPYMAPATVAWALLVVSAIGGPILLAAKAWIAGAILCVIAAVLGRSVPLRLHRLSRRWLVIVPAGLVVHDHLVLAETFMVRTAHLQSLEQRTVAGDEADLTGGVLGMRLTVAIDPADKVVLSPLTQRMLGTTEALHVRSFAIAPRRCAEAFTALTAG